MIPGTRVDRDRALIVWSARPAGLRIGFREGAVNIAAPEGPHASLRHPEWEGDTITAQRLAWAIRTRRPIDVSGQTGAHARLRCAPVGAGLWLVISRGGRSSTVVIPDSKCEEVADALANASALAQIPDVVDRAEWSEIHRSIATALDALLTLGLSTSYLRGVLP